ncbi:MAG: small subunit ribosomal protein S1 [Planctomycetota bacterium]
MVEVKVVRTKPGGLEVKIGALHAFMPKSQTGLERGDDPAIMIGKLLVCEVTEIDFERQRCSVSRKLVVQRGRANERQREIGSLAPGRIVQGRVSRVEGYGVFVRFGHGLEGMIHVSNLAWKRVTEPSDMFKVGQSIEAKILHVKRGGKRIGLGLKQMSESPWKAIERERSVGELLVGRITKFAEFGLFVEVAPGVEGLVHRSETGVGEGAALQPLAQRGEALTVRILSVDVEAERMSLSLLHETGRRIAPDEAEAHDAFQELAEGMSEGPATHLGELLRRALEESKE